MDKEFGETFGEMVERFENDIGKDKTKEIIFDTLGKLFGGYVSDPGEVLPKIKDMKISKHILDDSEPGAYLVGKFGNYLVEVILHN